MPPFRDSNNIDKKEQRKIDSAAINCNINKNYRNIELEKIHLKYLENKNGKKNKCMDI